MKKLLSANFFMAGTLLLGMGLQSCNNPQSTNDTPSTAAVEATDVSSSSLSEAKVQTQSEQAWTLPATRKEFAQTLHGMWISDEYLQNIQKKHSIYAARNQTLLCYWFDQENLMGKNSVAYGINTHEGGLDAPLQWNGKAFFSAKGNALGGMAQPFEIKVLNKNKIAIKGLNDGATQTFARRMEPQNINDILFAGTWQCGDKIFRLSSYGAVQGFDGYHHYSLIQDFFEIDFDVIVFKGEKGYKTYHYKFNDDNVVLYNINEGNEPGSSTIANEAMTLKRVNKTTNIEASPITTNYYDLPQENQQELKNILSTHDLSQLNEASLAEMKEYIYYNVIAGHHSQFGPFITSNYFWFIYNALPNFVADKERHHGYYEGETHVGSNQELLAYAIYRLDRSAENIQRIYQYIKPLISSMISKEVYERGQLATKIRNLIMTYEAMSKVPDHAAKMNAFIQQMDTITGSVVNYDGHDEFRRFENSAYGFSVYELSDMLMRHFNLDEEEFMNFTPDFSFWLRRQKEGNSEVVYSILKEVEARYTK